MACITKRVRKTDKGVSAMYDYLEQVQSAVRRLNYRVSRLVKELGSRSPIVENIIAKIDLMFDGNTRFKDGTIQVVKPKDIFLDPKKSKALQEMDKSVPTWGDLRRQYEDANLRAALREKLGGTTMVTVAQRVSSVKDCDLILVLDEGRIIGKGTHAELLESCAEYREISESQMGPIHLSAF